MKKLILAVALFIGFGAAAQTVEPNWESINKRGYPEWFSDAKLGIFIHWGVYSVPAYAGREGYGEWYYRGLMVSDTARLNFQRRVYGDDFKYSDFAPMFKAELWNPNQWADLFEQTGAKYVLLVTKHHDGYSLWDSPLRSDWTSLAVGPKRNIVSELTDAVRSHNMKMGFYYSLTEWTNPLHIWMQDPDDSIADYVENHMIPQMKDLISKYKPSVLFTDGEWNNNAEQFHAEELISWYYNTVGEEAIVNDRWGNGTRHGFRTPEYSSGIMLTDRPWAECRGLGRSFGLNRNEPLSNYLSSDELISHFVKLVAAGGGMTLNVGPAADGTIPLLQQERLLDLGNWLKINGEAIYGTRPYKTFYQYKPVEVTRIDSTIDFDWVRNSPDKYISYDNFDAVWTATITPNYSERYDFEAVANDSMAIYIDGNLINPDNQPTASLNLKKGKTYSIKVVYHENDKEAVAKLYWKSKRQPREAVRPTDGFEVVYSCQQPWLCFTAKGSTLYAIALELPEKELVINDFAQPDESLKVTLLGCGKVLPWRYENGNLIIDITPLKIYDLMSTAAWAFKLENAIF